MEFRNKENSFEWENHLGEEGSIEICEDKVQLFLSGYDGFGEFNHGETKLDPNDLIRIGEEMVKMGQMLRDRQ